MKKKKIKRLINKKLSNLVKKLVLFFIYKIISKN